MISWNDELAWLRSLMRDAGAAILNIYERPQIDVEFKSDASPLTEADRAGNEVLVAALAARYPGIPILSEESRHALWEERRHWTRCWMVDPLDGTKEFIKRNGEFTVNVALVENGAPVLGLVYQPVTHLLYWGSEAGAFREEADGAEPMRLQKGPHYATVEEPVVVASRSHSTPETVAFVDELTARGRTPRFLSSGSSLKLCLVAEGKAHVYPRFGPTMEWDTAAAHAVAAAAGCQVNVYPAGQPLRYNKENLLNPWFIVE